jgi:hypothetical protein
LGEVGTRVKRSRQLVKLRQARSVVAVGAMNSQVSALHVVHAEQLGALGTVLKPVTHAVQTWSTVAVPALLTYCPATQAVHAVQLGTLAALLNRPAPQALQVRLAVAEPGALTKEPGPHDAHATQSVAPRPSWSQVPLAQGVAAAEPPGQ